MGGPRETCRGFRTELYAVSQMPAFRGDAKHSMDRHNAIAEGRAGPLSPTALIALLPSSALFAAQTREQWERQALYLPPLLTGSSLQLTRSVTRAHLRSCALWLPSGNVWQVRFCPPPQLKKPSLC